MPGVALMVIENRREASFAPFESWPGGSREKAHYELFFKWIKTILNCRHWLAESPAGARIQIYCVLIASLPRLPLLISTYVISNNHRGR